MPQDLRETREKITAVDMQIIELLRERMGLAGEVAEYKMAHELPVFDPAREAEILAQYEQMVDFDVSGIFQAIMDESKRIQQTKISH